MTTPHVFEAIAAVMGDLAAEGISKSRRNSQQGYNFRGIDEVYNALSSVLAKHKLVITPRALARTCEERQTKSGGALFYVTVDMEFILTSAVDGSTVTARTFGEAMDSADKATNKAMSAAYKYMAMQQFCIPTEGDNDADANTHDVAPRRAVDPAAADFAISGLRAHSDSPTKFKAFWNANKDGWKGVMEDSEYARVVGIMKEIAATFAKTEAPAEEVFA